MLGPERVPSPISVIQQVSWEGSQLKARLSSEQAFDIPSDVPPSLARAYLRARVRSPLSREVDVCVVLDGSITVAHGSPTDWPSGIAERLISGDLSLGTLRIQVVDAKDVEPCRDPAPVHNVLESATLSQRSEAVQHSQSRTKCAQLEQGASSTQSTSRIERTVSEINLDFAAASLRLNRLKVGVSTDPGGCSYMEDEHSIHAPRGANFAIYCVYDGHGGDQGALFCRERLHFNVVGAPTFHQGDTQSALIAGFRKTEADLLAEQREIFRRGGLPTGDSNGGWIACDCCGCTALVLVVLHDSLHLAWTGDCRAVLCRGGVAVPLTIDHNAYSPREVARVMADGGVMDGNRLGGFLEVTRALGDLDAATGSKPPGLSGEPELRSEPVHVDDEFVVLGSDGLWSAIGTEEVVRIARAELQAYNDASIASDKLVEVALKRHVDDNITAMVVCLRPVAPPAAPQQQRRRLILQNSSAKKGLVSFTALEIGEGQARLQRLTPS